MASRRSKTTKNNSGAQQRPVPPRAAAMARRAAENKTAEKNGERLKPRPAPNERTEDLAVFTNTARELLPEDLQQECSKVMEALELAFQGDFTQANERLKNIPRNSPYADWRLFLRGLCGFYSSDFEVARQNWQRLDTSRRPARIAATLLSAELQEPLGAIPTRPSRLLAAAKSSLHRAAAIAEAKKILAVKHRDPEVLFSHSQVAMLLHFSDDFRRFDKEFVARFAQGCVYLSCNQPDPAAFELLKKSVPGPAHDPSWNLQQFLYLLSFDDVEDLMEESVAAFIETDLPRIANLSKEQKGALASCLLLRLAKSELDATKRSSFPFTFFSEPVDFKAIEQQLAGAIRFYPTNREAHRLLIETLDEELDSRRGLSRPQSAAIEKRLLKAKEALVKAFPNDIETSLFLVDHYFDENEIEKANALIEKLSSQRLDAPLAKALPWKVKLREAMHLSRLKGSVAAARLALDAAETQWPVWFGRDWLPFLRAALELRAGNRELFESLDEAARKTVGTTPIVGDFMTFAALQQMNIPIPILKPFREKISSHLLKPEAIPLADLFSLGAFFGDLTRTGLEHKGYRLQASKLGKAICARMKRGEAVKQDESFVGGCCWCARHGFWQSSYESNLPDWVAAVATNPKVAAAIVAWLIPNYYSARSLVKHRSLVDVLRESARTEKDPFYRYRSEQLVAQATALIAAYESERSSGGPAAWFNPKLDAQADVSDERDEMDSEMEGATDDIPCDCPDCVAERAREAARKRGPKASAASGQTFLEFEDLGDFADDVPAAC
jgi:hypothetical protein